MTQPVETGKAGRFLRRNWRNDGVRNWEKLRVSFVDFVETGQTYEKMLDVFFDG